MGAAPGGPPDRWAKGRGSCVERPGLLRWLGSSAGPRAGSGEEEEQDLAEKWADGREACWCPDPSVPLGAWVEGEAVPPVLLLPENVRRCDILSLARLQP